MTSFKVFYSFLAFLICSYFSNGLSLSEAPSTNSSFHSRETSESSTIVDSVTQEELWKLRDKCCYHNDFDSFCTAKKCYFVSEGEESFSASRTFCSRYYVKLHRLADAATFQEESELEGIKTFLKEDTYWIGGLSCPDINEESAIHNGIWLNDGKSIPDWLRPMRNAEDSGCKILTVNNNGSLVFSFNNGTEKYSILCELKIPQDPRNQPTTEVSPDSTEMSTTTPLDSTELSTTTDVSKGWCRALEHKGINWPKTPGGEEAKVACPEEMIGNATLKCDARTNQFVLEPNMTACVSSWFKDIEDRIEKNGDAMEIAEDLAEKTDSNELKFGDLPGVIRAMKSLNNVFNHSSNPEKRRKFGKVTVQIGSNLLTKSTSWEQLDTTLRLKSASKLLTQVQAIGKMISCRGDEDLEDEDISSEKILLQSFIFKDNEQRVFPRIRNKGVNTTSSLHLPSDLILPHSLPMCNKLFHTGYGILYNGIASHLSDQSKPERKVSSQIISFTYGKGDKSIHLETGKEVMISLKHTMEIQNPQPTCVFWNFTSLQWEDTGCWSVGSNQTHTQCKCSHLTNFAVLMDLSGDIRGMDDAVMKYLSIICCGCSAIALIFTIACLIGFRASHSRRNTITCNLAFCLLTINLLVLFGIKRTEIKIICQIIAAMLHYTGLASFCWMLLEGYHLYQMVIVVFEKVNAVKLRWFCLSAYGIPLLIVLPSVIASPNSYGDNDACWISARDNMIWVFAGPVAIILLINLTILIMALQSASSVKMKKQQSKAKNMLGWIKGSFSLMTLLGITWIIGFINIYKGVPELAYMFIILNGLQGCFIMVFHVIINEKVRGCFIAFVTRAQVSGKGFRSSHQTTTSSRNPLHSQRRSESGIGSPMYFSNPRRISVSPASTTYTGHM